MQIALTFALLKPVLLFVHCKYPKNLIRLLSDAVPIRFVNCTL